MGDYRVNLDIFAGPLDLLLYLVRKEEVDIYDISLTKITDQYIHFIDMLKQFDIDLAGDFLVMAATLMQIKSAMLLPKADPDEVDIEELADPRAELIRQLLDYKRFKDAANLLAGAADIQKERYPRPDTVVEHLKPDADLTIEIEQVSVWDLLDAFDSIMQATGSAIEFNHIKDETPIDLYQTEILESLQTQGPMSFERIFESKTNRLIMIGLFLALLELIREELVMVEQPKSSGAIYLRSLTDEPAREAVQKAIEASELETDKEQTASTQTQQPQIPITELPARGKTSDTSSSQQQVNPLHSS